MIKRTVFVSRTAHDLNHVNKLVVPTFGIRRLALVKGAKASKSHLPQGSPPPKAEDKGSNDFHFVPEHETIEIQYEIDDKFAAVESAKLQLFTRFEEAAIWELDLTPLGKDFWSHGEHVIQWDGRIIKPTAEQKATDNAGVAQHDWTKIAVDKMDKFPDGYVTLEHTPYKLKMTLIGKTGRGLPEVAWTYYHILLKSFLLELGAEETIPASTVNDAQHKRDKAVRNKIVADGGMPAAAGTRKVVLLSNVYKTSLAEMDNNSGHTEYQTLWGDGPNIPIIAKIRLLDSADGEVKLETDKGAVALGHVKFLWDWEDPDERVDAQCPPAKPNAFIKNAINYYKNGTDPTRAGKDHTYPKGDNSHLDHGGKRGPDATTIFPAQAGYAPAASLTAGKFPFKVEACKTRKWAALSEAWGSGAMKGRTGIVFQPARMGGDDYKLTVYLAYDRAKKDELKLDVKDEPLVCPDQIKSETTGIFQVWREIHIARYVRKRSSIPAFLPGNLAGFQTHFQMAYIDVLDKMGGNQSYAVSTHLKANGTAPNYDTLIKARLTATGNALVTQNMIVDPSMDHSLPTSMFQVRNYAAFVTNAHVRVNPVPAAAGDLAAAGIAPGSLGTTNLAPLPNGARKTRLIATKNWLVSWAAETDVKYARVADNIGFAIGEPLANDLQFITGGPAGVGAAPPGVTTVHFDFTNTELRDLFNAGVGIGYWYGAAIDPSDADRNRCVIMFWMAGVDEFSHEYGHHVFLPHAKYPTASPPGGHQDNRHDDTDAGCLMSYSQVRPGFCGLCQLRLRGWSATKLDKVSANNKKP